MRILCRYVLAWMGALGIMNVYFCRINLSTAMVAMVGVEKHSKPEPNTNTSHSQCPGPVQVEGEDQVFPEGEFSWTKKQQGLVTGSYYWGYATCQVFKQIEKILSLPLKVLVLKYSKFLVLMILTLKAMTQMSCFERLAYSFSSK